MPTALDRYPVAARLGSREMILRPLQRGDDRALAAFFRRLPVDERAMLKDDVTRADVVARWCAEVDYARVLPLLALDGGRIVGDATLHRHRGGWSRHVAQVRVSIDPEYRRAGLARALVREILDVAEAMGVAVVDAEILDAQDPARRLFENLGFVTVATLPQHALDFNHQPHDVLVLSRTLIPVERLSPDAVPDERDEGGGD